MPDSYYNRHVLVLQSMTNDILGKLALLSRNVFSLKRMCYGTSNIDGHASEGNVLEASCTWQTRTFQYKHLLWSVYQLEVNLLTQFLLISLELGSLALHYWWFVIHVRMKLVRWYCVLDFEYANWYPLFCCVDRKYSKKYNKSFKSVAPRYRSVFLFRFTHLSVCPIQGTVPIGPFANVNLVPWDFGYTFGVRSGRSLISVKILIV